MRQVNQYYCYILTSARNGTLYTGVTSDLIRRVHEHKAKTAQGFSSQHKVHQLVWFEAHNTFESACLREKRIKKWNRQWKLRLIESKNPKWEDLYLMISGKLVFLDSRLRGNDEWAWNDEWAGNDGLFDNDELLDNAGCGD